MFILWFNIQRKIEMTAHIRIVHVVKMGAYIKADTSQNKVDKY